MRRARSAFALVVIAVMAGVAACGSSESSSGNDGGTGGGTSAECATLIGEYAAALVIAQSCDPAASSCSVSVADGLECPCQTFVANDAQRLASLDQIRQSWLAKGCDSAVDCSAAGACQTPTGATCEASPQDPTSAYCKNTF